MDPKSYLALVEDRDTPLLLQALHRAGVSAEAFSWHDREVDWSQLDLAVLRTPRSEEHTSELQSRGHLVCRLLLEKKKKHTRQRTKKLSGTTATADDVDDGSKVHRDEA